MTDSAFFRSRIALVASDRDCGALAVAAAHGVPAVNLGQPDVARFSDALSDLLTSHRIDYLIAFYTRLLTGRLLDEYRGRLINTHLSLLPAFPGLRAFERAVAGHSRFIGTTVHFIDETEDGGPQIIQSVCAVDPGAPPALLRHKLFEQQCRTVLQVVKWLDDGRIDGGRPVVIHGGSYRGTEFSPDLDFPEALAFGQAPVNPTGA